MSDVLEKQLIEMLNKGIKPGTFEAKQNEERVWQLLSSVREEAEGKTQEAMRLRVVEIGHQFIGSDEDGGWGWTIEYKDNGVLVGADEERVPEGEYYLIPKVKEPII